MDISDAVTSWLLDADPAIRWQVQRDVLDTAPAQWQSTRARVAREGFGAALLAEQDPEGTWAGGAFFPAGFFDSPETEAPGQP